MKRLISYAIVLSMAISLWVGEVALGESAACTHGAASPYTGVITLALDTYDVYVKLGKAGQSAIVESSVSADGGNGDCQAVGTVMATGNAWNKIGVYQSDGEGSEVLFRLSSEVLTNLPNANRPSLLLVSRTRPACTPAVECETTIDGTRAFIRPNSNNLAANALRITVAKDVNDDNVKQVLYYVNNELMYQTKTLEPFNMQAVPYYGTVMTRVIEYASGQTAVVQNDVPADHTDNLAAMLAREVNKYANTLLFIAITLGVLLLVRLVKALIHFRRQRYYWRMGHGFIKEKIPQYTATQSANWQLLRRIYMGVEVIVVIGIVVVGLVLVVNTYMGQIATVRGDSMEAAYKNEQKVIVNKLPVTLAHINHRDFIPKRGEVVVARPSYGASVDSAERGGEMMIKRVIGLPGDKVIIRDGEITIFNAAHPDGFNPALNTDWAGFIQPGDNFRDDIVITLNESELFVVGDNRPVSIDSRFNGPISANNLIGVVLR